MLDERVGEEREREREREGGKKPCRQRIWAQASCYRPSGVFNQHTHTHTHTHTHAACCCPLTGLLTPPTSGTRTLIDLNRIKKKESEHSLLTSFLFSWKLSRCCDSCDPQMPHLQGFDPSAAKVLNMTFLWTSNSIYSL